ncbi:family 78 glycoside hydrolase catalytic domain [Prevotella sp. KH2C16]|uniref:alpha-L-rhamnosidase-related protein n=1 Tax=Prevotella sp. KH2C16 TaxID=1855325 RepID=UPI0008EE7B71|nr:family 78 glycoside hydrolase catalytic domain [Prevotella sp. KH2C16]SFG39452.1 alpha-L-rhamnosidase [Prevotella sp. KH2C16]
MKHQKAVLAIILTCISTLTWAQTDLPPTFKGEENRVRADELKRAYLLPTRIVWKRNVSYEHNLLQMTNGQPELGKAGMCLMRTRGQDTASILLDYGREIHGGLHLTMGSGNRREPSKVRIRFGESVQECNSVCDNSDYNKWQKPNLSDDDHAKRDIILEIPRDGQIEIGNTGFRFVRIDLLQPEAQISIKEATAIFRFRDIPYLGSFQSSDSRLDSIWLTGAYTVHLNMQEFLWDGIKRDRLVWVGDLHPEVSTLMSVFGNNEVVPRSLDFACQEFPLPRWLNNMPAYSMWYLIIQYEWWMQNADRSFLDRHHDYIIGLIDLFDKSIDEKGVLKGTSFLDWPSSPDKEGVKTGVQALLIWAMKDGRKLCDLFGDAGHKSVCESIISRLRKNIRKPKSLKQAAALEAIAGTMNPKEVFKRYLEADGAKGFSTFYGYYMLEAEALAGRYQEALDVIREYWGGMLDLGATTFWEDFDLKWAENTNRIDELGDPDKKNAHGSFGAYCYPGFRLSLCHGWASGPTAWLSRHVLGFRTIEAGCRKISVEPHLGDLTWVKGSYPTPFGIVSAIHEKQPDGSVKSSIRKPKAVEIVCNSKNCTISDY